MRRKLLAVALSVCLSIAFCTLGMIGPVICNAEVLTVESAAAPDPNPDGDEETLSALTTARADLVTLQTKLEAIRKAAGTPGDRSAIDAAVEKLKAADKELLRAQNILNPGDAAKPAKPKLTPRVKFEEATKAVTTSVGSLNDTVDAAVKKADEAEKVPANRPSFEAFKKSAVKVEESGRKVQADAKTAAEASSAYVKHAGQDVIPPGVDLKRVNPLTPEGLTGILVKPSLTQDLASLQNQLDTRQDAISKLEQKFLLTQRQLVARRHDWNQEQKKYSDAENRRKLLLGPESILLVSPPPTPANPQALASVNRDLNTAAAAIKRLETEILTLRVDLEVVTRNLYGARLDRRAIEAQYNFVKDVKLSRSLLDTQEPVNQASSR